MNEETTKRLTEWAEKLGLPIADLETTLNTKIATFKKTITGKTDIWYEETSRHRLYLEIKSELQSPARPHDLAFVGLSGKVDVTATEIDEKKALWNNLQTREQAVAERKVYRFDPNTEPVRMVKKDAEGKEIPVLDGTPLDTREWMIAPNAEKDEKGRRNRNFGKVLEHQLIRTLIAVGRPATGGKLKLFNIMMAGDRTDKIPPLSTESEVKPVRTRINIREDGEVLVEANGASVTRFNSPITMPEIPDGRTLLNILASAPDAVRTTLDKLPAWHAANAENARRTVIIEADVMSINRELSQYGSYMMTLEDTSKEDLAAEGTTAWVPKELKERLDSFGRTSKVLTIARTNEGEGYDRETRQRDPTKKRIMLNAMGIIVFPEFRVPPEEESVIEAMPVK